MGSEPATRGAYDRTAREYVELIGTAISADIEAASDVALLEGFLRRCGGVVADLGCGPGRVAALATAHGHRIVALDLSAGILAEASAAHRSISFVQGDLHRLPIRTAAVDAAVCWYSIIHTALAGLPAIAVELARVVRADGDLLVAFQAGAGERVELRATDSDGAPLIAHRHPPALVVEVLEAAGFVVGDARVRPPTWTETTEQAFVTARLGGLDH